jgi:hypothetical protein
LPRGDPKQRRPCRGVTRLRRVGRRRASSEHHQLRETGDPPELPPQRELRHQIFSNDEEAPGLRKSIGEHGERLDRVR